MNKVPEIISGKDLMYIEDMLNWNFTTIKKINCYIDCISDKDVQDTLNNCTEMLKSHYASILKNLNLGGSND